MKQIYTWNSIPEQRLDPPDYPEPRELDDMTEELEISLDIYIEATEDMIEFLVKTKEGLKGDLQWDWARSDRKDGSWRSDEYSSVTLADYVSVVENVGDLLADDFDRRQIFSGYWHLVGYATLEFELSNILELDDEVFEDEIEVSYKAKTSKLTVKFLEEVDAEGNKIKQ